MDAILLEASKDHSVTLWVNIGDVHGAPATLYLLNGGTRPDNPILGDFAYDFYHTTFEFHSSEGWKGVNIADVQAGVHHPEKPWLSVTFTSKALPYWTNRNSPCTFSTVDTLLSHFRTTVNTASVKKHRSKASSEAAGLKRNHPSDALQGEQSTPIVQKKRPRLGSSSQVLYGKDPLRFVRSLAGFPKDSPKILWDASFQTYVPFCGQKAETNSEAQVVKELSKRPSVEASGSERCGPDPDAFQVQDLIVELEFDPRLGGGTDAVHEAWQDLISKIASHLSQSRSVVVRGWKELPQLGFSALSMSMQFGDLGQRCQWVDGIKFSAAENSGEGEEIHRITTLKDFFDLAHDPTVCGNFLDAKNVNPGPPLWMTPLLDSTRAWNKTMHLRMTCGQKKNDKFMVSEDGPVAIRSATWTSPGWRLVTHPGFVTHPHHDCCGMATYVVGNTGCKIWAVMRPKRKWCNVSGPKLADVFRKAMHLSDQGRYAGADIATVCLEDGDVMFQPPGTIHAVYTPVSSIFSGGYFYHYETMHLTRAVLSITQKDGSLTNDYRPGYFRTLCRMMIALSYRDKPRKLGKRSLLSLILMVRSPQQDIADLEKEELSALVEEERGDLKSAQLCANRLLKWLNMSLLDAKAYVDHNQPYYTAGEEVIEIPGRDHLDLFPSF